MSRAPQQEDGVRLSTEVQAVTRTIAGDLGLVAALHDREPPREWLEAARACPIAEQFGLSLQSEAGRAALEAFDAAMAELPEVLDQRTLDGLAAEYANIYLRYLYRAAPSESVWLDEDHLERQAPMFAVKHWYRRHNLTSQDWAKRPDDHLVVELRFLAHIFANASSRDDLAEAARFMDEHLLRWTGQFCRRVAGETPSLYFAAVARLTDAYLEELRNQLEAAAGLPRQMPGPPAPRKAAPELTCGDEMQPFVPGAGPGW